MSLFYRSIAARAQAPYPVEFDVLSKLLLGLDSGNRKAVQNITKDIRSAQGSLAWEGVAAKWLDDMNNSTLTEAQRATAKANYTEKIATAGFPNKPDGKPMSYRAAVKTGVVFKDSKNKDLAKKFVAFLLDDANLTPYVEGSLGRWFPVTKAGQASAFWKGDPHRLAVYNQFMAGTQPFEFTKNYKFTVLNNENVWAKAMNRVLSEKWAVDRAVDEMIARIKTVAAN